MNTACSRQLFSWYHGEVKIILILTDQVVPFNGRGKSIQEDRAHMCVVFRRLEGTLLAYHLLKVFRIQSHV